jgi:hypothetical protein
MPETTVILWQFAEAKERLAVLLLPFSYGVFANTA